MNPDRTQMKANRGLKCIYFKLFEALQQSVNIDHPDALRHTDPHKTQRKTEPSLTPCFQNKTKP